MSCSKELLKVKISNANTSIIHKVVIKNINIRKLMYIGQFDL
jgi:hypothetical protein